MSQPPVCPACRRVVPPQVAACPACGAPLVAPRALPPDVALAARDPARRFGPYVLLAELGRGGMGSVHRAWDTRLSRLVALKLLLDEHGTDAVTRFHREAEAVARLAHPNIVAVHEAGVLVGKHFLAMELVGGSPLAALVRREEGGRRLTLAKAVEVMRDAARGVHHAHEQGVIHRDLKPQNIMVGEGDRAKVLDFGLAALRTGGPAITRSGAFMGTPAYMPPEQTGEGHAVDRRSDVYSLGATLYEVLTGRPPFEGETPINLITAVLTTDPTPPSRVNPRVPADLETICLRCLEKEPERRYPTAEALALELDRYLRDEPIEARPLGRLEHLRRKARRHYITSVVLAAAGLTTVATATTGVVALVRNASLRLEADRAEARAARVEADAKTRALEDERRRLEEVKAENARSTRRLAALYVERSRRAAQDGLFGDAAAFASKALSLGDGPAFRIAQLLACTGPWRRPAVIGKGRVVAASPDGRVAATGGRDGELTVWDTAGDGPPKVLHRSPSPRAVLASLVAVSPRGDRAAIGLDDGSVRVVDVETGRDVGAFVAARAGPGAKVEGLALGEGIVAITGSGGLRIHDVASKQVLLEAASIRGGRPGVVAVRPARATELGVAVISTSTAHVLVIDPRGEVEATVEIGPRVNVRALAWSPDGRGLAAAGDDGAIRLLTLGAKDAPLAERLRTTASLADARSFPGALAFDATGATLIAGCFDASVAVWDVAARRKRATLVGHGALQAGAVFSADGRRALSAAYDGTVRLWDLGGGLGMPVAPAPTRVFGVALRGRHLATATPDGVRLFDAATGRLVARLAADLHTSVALSPDGGLLAAGSFAGDTSVWDTSTREKVASVRGAHMTCVAFEAKGPRLAIGGHDGTLRLVELPGANELASTSLRARVHSVAFLSDGRVVAATPGGGVHVWSGGARDATPIRSAERGPRDLSWVAPIGNDRLAVVVGERLEVTSLSGGDVRRTAVASDERHRSGQAGVAATPRWVAAAATDADRAVDLLDAATLERKALFPSDGGEVVGLAFDGAGDRLAIATGTDVRVWDLAAVLVKPPPAGPLCREIDEGTGLTVDESSDEPRLVPRK